MTFCRAALAGLSLCLLLSTAALAEEEESEFGVLVVAEGVEDTYYSCIACHSELIVAQQGLTRAQWEDLLDWMVEDQGMPELEPEIQEVVLDYLALHYNVDRPNFPDPVQ
ncbi:MAG: hypothetical protein Kilf2KO_29920 [Rhodospirillales bacterium]